MIWTPFPTQRIALSCPATELFFGGARGGGKSDFLLVDFLDGVQNGAAWKGMLIRQSFPELEELIARARVMYQGKATWKESSRTFYFQTGAILRCRFIDDDFDVYKYQGHEYPWLGWDELTNFSSDWAYRMMFGCNRSAAGLEPRIRATGNPGTVGHSWVKKRFIDPAPPKEIFKDKETGVTRCFIPSRLDDNIYLMENDPGYDTRLKQVGTKTYKAWRFGDWNQIVGSMLDEFDQDVHVITKRVGRDDRVFCAMDWGYAKPYSIGFYAYDGEVLNRFDEMYGEGPNPGEGSREEATAVAKRAFEEASKYGIDTVVADPSCWNKIGTGASVATIFGQYFKMAKANNDRASGLIACRKILAGRDDRSNPLFVVSSRCRNFIRTIPVLVQDKRDPEDIDSKGEDHVYDEWRYAVQFMHLAPRRRKEKPKRFDYLRAV